jgi:hypothetical protein
MDLFARKRLRLWMALALMLIVLNVAVTVSGLY